MLKINNRCFIITLGTLTFGVIVNVFASFVVSAEDQQEFKVGMVLPLSGPVAEYGVAAKNGIELSRKEHPDLFKNVKFIFDDSQYDGKKALSSFQKLKAEGVSLLYVWGYGPNQALAPVAETQHFPIIAVSAERSIVANKQYILRFCYHIEMIADSLLKHLRAHNVKHMAIVKTELAYMNGLIDAMKKNLKDNEQIEIIDNFEASDSDFKTTIAKLRSRKFDSLGVFLISGQISQFYRQIKQLKFQTATFGTDFFDSSKEAKDAEGAMTGAIFAAPFADGGFVTRYEKEYGNDLQVAWAANAYEFALLIGKFFGDQDEIFPPEEILRKFRNLKNEQGEVAKYQFRESPEGSGIDFKVVLRRVEADRIVDAVN